MVVVYGGVGWDDGVDVGDGGMEIGDRRMEIGE